MVCTCFLVNLKINGDNNSLGEKYSTETALDTIDFEKHFISKLWNKISLNFPKKN